MGREKVKTGDEGEIDERKPMSPEAVQALQEKNRATEKWLFERLKGKGNRLRKIEKDWQAL